MHIDFYRGTTHRREKKWEFFSLSGSLTSLLLPPSKWAPIPTLFRMITDRYNKNGNIQTLCARQLATGLNTRSGPQLPFFSSAPWTRHTVTRVTSHVKYAVAPFSLTLVQLSTLKKTEQRSCDCLMFAES
jgi:hypothetical protein